MTVTPLDSPRILEAMSEFPTNDDLNREDPLEQLLDEETDEEFGLPQFKEHFADSLTPAVLKDWTAADFASIYVRFRPHLERHARRFLVNPSQVEEVVQDAFLYLMTTLPELDSELGVLKFLKWKTRLLALDVIRANSRATMAPIDDQPEMAADLPEMSDGLEHADDAAIVSLALAKLQPRHREALIATLYEEKSTEVVAAQMGLSENAFRQLLFRARASFKKALVGEAEIQGKSISQILSIAARKAAAESGKYITAAGAFLLVLAIAIGVLPNLSNSVTESELAVPSATASQTPETEQGVSPTVEPIEGAAVTLPATESAPINPSLIQNAPGVSPVIRPAITVTTKADSVEPVTESERVVLEGYLQETLDSNAVAVLSAPSITRVVSADRATAGTITLANDSGLTANVGFDLATETGIQHTWITMNVGGIEFVAVAKASYAQKTTGNDGSVTLNYIATDLLVGDTSGNFNYIAIDNTLVSRSALRISITLNAAGDVTDSSLTLTPRS